MGINRDYVEVINRPSDAGSWTVRRWKKFLWFKRMISSRWFLDEQQARLFALKLKRELGQA